MRAIVFIDRNILYYFGGDAKTALSLQLPPTSVQDMEVINSEELVKGISDFVKANKLKPSSLLYCFSSQNYFQKEIPEKTTPEEIESLRIEFADNVPFNRVLSKYYMQGKLSKIIALNKDFAFTIKKAFENLSFSTEAIVPAFALYGDQPVTFNSQVGEQLLKHFNSLQQVTFPVHDEEPVTVDHEEKEFTGEKKESNKRLYVLLGVFGLLILVLILFYYMMRIRPAQKQMSGQLSPSTEPAQTLPTFTPVPVSPSPTVAPDVDKEDIIIEILNGSGTPGEADRVKDRLGEAGFTNIITGNAPTQTSEKTSIVFKPSVPRLYRDEVVTMVKSLGFDVITRENDEITNDILITTFQTGEEDNES